MKNVLIAILFAASVHGSTQKLPTMVDLNEMSFVQTVPEGKTAFNSSPEIASVIHYLKDLYEIEVAFETGTFKGNTTDYLARIFSQVHTAEIVGAHFQAAREKFAADSHVHCHLGSSETVLKEILPNLKGQRALFYLDAHWQEHWPLLQEIEEIGKTHRDNCIIVIDDFKIPGRKDIDYDRYGGKECSFSYIRKKLDDAFSEYDFHFLIPVHPSSRGKFVAIPRSWAT